MQWLNELQSNYFIPNNSCSGCKLLTWTQFSIKLKNPNEFKANNFHRHQWLSLNINKLWQEIITTCERISQQQSYYSTFYALKLRAFFMSLLCSSFAKYEWMKMKKKTVYSFFRNPVPQSCFVLECERINKIKACDLIICGFLMSLWKLLMWK